MGGGGGSEETPENLPGLPAEGVSLSRSALGGELVSRADLLSREHRCMLGWPTFRTPGWVYNSLCKGCNVESHQAGGAEGERYAKFNHSQPGAAKRMTHFMPSDSGPAFFFICFKKFMSRTSQR